MATAGTSDLRSGCALLLLAGLAACTEYQPLAWDGRGSWAQARAAAARAALAPKPRVAAASDGRGAPAVAVAKPGRDGGRHLVLPGESLGGLAGRYGVTASSLAEANRIAPPFAVRAGQVLAIPPGGRVAATPKVTMVASPGPAGPTPAGPAIASRALDPPVSPAPAIAAGEPLAEPPGQPSTEPLAESAPAAAEPSMTRAELAAARRAAAQLPPPLSGEGFLWPVGGRIVDGFGAKPNGARNNGVDIAARAGAPVLAAENGVVVYAGNGIPGYGNMLLISHATGLTTAYANNRDLLVRVGDLVRRGQRVATVGVSGGTAAPQLHFELRDGKNPIDPVAFLDADGTKLASTR